MRVLVALLAGLVLAAPAAAATPQQLLERYRPVLVLHPQERFAPVPVETFTQGADLAAGGYDFRGCSPTMGLEALSCYRQDGEPTAYGAVFRQGKRLALQYWLFYVFDLWSPVVPQSADFWQAHEGDWEAVTVLLDERQRPELVGVSRHCGGARLPWARAPKRGGRPLVYVALGSHANFFSTGTTRLDPRCWPKEAVAIYKAYGVEMLDHTGQGRVLSPRVVRVTASSPAWMRFAGPWGEKQYAHFPQATFAFGTSPRGPAFHELWRRPFAVPAAWPLA